MAAPVHHTIQNNTFWLLPQRALYWEEQKAIIVSDLHLGKTGHFRKEGIAVPQSVYKDDLHRLFHLIQYYKPEQLIIAGDMFHSRMNKEVDLFTRWRNDVSHLHIRLIKGNHDILLDGHYTSAGITLSHQYLHMDTFCFVHDMEDVGKLENREDGKTVSEEDGKQVRSTLSKVHGKEEEAVNRQSSNGNKVYRASSVVHSNESSIANRAAICTDDDPQSAIIKQKPETENRKLETNINPPPQNSNEKPVTSNPFYFSGHIHPGIVLKTGSRQSMRFPCYYFTPGYAVLPAFSAFSGMYCVSPKKNDTVFAIVNGAVLKMGK